MKQKPDLQALKQREEQCSGNQPPPKAQSCSLNAPAGQEDLNVGVERGVHAAFLPADPGPLEGEPTGHGAADWTPSHSPKEPLSLPDLVQDLADVSTCCARPGLHGPRGEGSGGG